MTNNTTDEWTWTVWEGGECPLEDGVEFKVMLADQKRAAVYIYKNATKWRWSATGHGGDVAAYAIRNPNYVATPPADYAALLKMAEQALGYIVTRSYDDGMSKVIYMRDIAQTTLDKIRKATP